MKETIFEYDTLQPLALAGWEDAPVRLRVEAATSREKNIQTSIQQLVTLEVAWHY